MKNEEKTPSNAKKGKGFGIRNTVRRKDFAGTIEALNKIQVKFDCGKGTRGDDFRNVYG